MDINFDARDIPVDTSPLMRTFADAGVAPVDELQQHAETGPAAESSLTWIERELDSATAQLTAVRDRLEELRADEDGRERELLVVREQNAKLREARLADVVRIQALETQLGERDKQAAEIAATLAEAARALGAA